LVSRVSIAPDERAPAHFDEMILCSLAFARGGSGWLKSRSIHPDYFFELKHDGFRTIADIDSGDCRLVSRNLKALPFNSLRASLAAITVANAILDGEIVVLD
jgi:hypothetical protein